MPRVIDAFAQFLDGSGDPLIDGWLHFTEAGTNNTDKDTFSDNAETIANDNPLQLDAEGRCPSVFGSGSYRVVSYTNDDVLDQPDVQMQQFDPVGELTGSTPFQAWNEYTVYPLHAITQGSDLNYYSSLIADNQGNDPTLDATKWEQVEMTFFYNISRTYAANDMVRLPDGRTFVSRVSANLNNYPPENDTEWKALNVRAWTAGQSFAIYELCQDLTGALWRSTADNNTGNQPQTDGGVNWIDPANEASVLVKTGGGTLQRYKSNEIQDTDTYTLPLASTVESGGWVDVEITDVYALFEPTVECAGADSLTSRDFVDTDIIFDTQASARVRFISDGVSDWRI
jgi:hypothetical protein